MIENAVSRDDLLLEDEFFNHQATETFRGLRVRCDDMSPSVRKARLRGLRSAGIVSLEGDAGYALKAHGLELLRALKPLSSWARAWARRRASQAARSK